jgi:hypothetical protein
MGGGMSGGIVGQTYIYVYNEWWQQEKFAIFDEQSAGQILGNSRKMRALYHR